LLASTLVAISTSVIQPGVAFADEPPAAELIQPAPVEVETVVAGCSWPASS